MLALLGACAIFAGPWHLQSRLERGDAFVLV